MKRILQLAALMVGLLPMLAADPSTTRLDRIGHKLVCQCGCGQILMECNHVGCPVSPVMISELRAQLAADSGEKHALAFFINKYGPIVLAAPIRGGFDNTAWIVPIAIALLCGFGVFLLARRWSVKRDAGAAVGAARYLNAEQERIRRETDYERWDV